MEPFTVVTGIVAPLGRSNVDTDQIIPSQFLKRIERTGYGEFAFLDWRYLLDGQPNPEFELNQPGYEGAKILVTGRNFGSGSSREHAVWALREYGFRAIIAPSFANIFYNNCIQNGVLPLVLPEERVRELMSKAREGAGCELTVDLEQQLLYDAEGFRLRFEIDQFVRERLLKGLDGVSLTLRDEEKIDAFESQRPRWLTRAEK